MLTLISGVIFVYESTIAILTFDPAYVFGNLQPNAGMAERASAITGDPPLIYNLGFGGRRCHAIASGLGAR